MIMSDPTDISYLLDPRLCSAAGLHLGQSDNGTQSTQLAGAHHTTDISYLLDPRLCSAAGLHLDQSDNGTQSTQLAGAHYTSESPLSSAPAASDSLSPFENAIEKPLDESIAPNTREMFSVLISIHRKGNASEISSVQ